MNIVAQKMFKKAKIYLFPPKLSREAFEAYYFRLPENIEVSWKRDNDFIIGKVIAGDSQFMTQGKSADNFIDMVNDAIYTVFGIPLEYINEIKKVKTYDPPTEAKEKLENLNIKENAISLKRNKVAIRQLA